MWYTVNTMYTALNRAVFLLIFTQRCFTLEGLVTKLENASGREWEEVRTHLLFEAFVEVAPEDI